VYQGSGQPDYLIVSDLPLRAPPGALRQVNGIRDVLERRHYTAGKFKIGYQSCDDSSAAAGHMDPARCAVNAKAYAQNPAVLGVIGPYNSPCAALQIPITNASSSGPLVMIGTGTTDPSLTSAVPAGEIGTPGKFYPSGRRSFVRLTAPDQYQAAAAALLARRHHLRRVFVVDDREGYGHDMAAWFRRDAGKVAVPIVGSGAWNPKAAHYAKLVSRVKAARPDGVYLSGYSFLHGGLLLKELRAALGGSVLMFAPDGFSEPEDLEQSAGSAGKGLLVTWAGVPPRDAGPEGIALARRTKHEEPLQYGALYGAAAASVLLDAIAASDGTRVSVTHAVFAAQTPTGIIGRFGFDREGDPTVGAMTILRMDGKKGFTLDPTVYPSVALAKG